MKKKKTIFLLILLTISIFTICNGAMTKAKYVSNTVWNYYLKSKGFYLTSDYLSNTEIKNTNTLWNGESVHFNIKNSQNQTLISDDNINYQVTCTINGEVSNHAVCLLNCEAENPRKCLNTHYSVQNGTLSKSEVCVNNDGIDTSAYNKTECELHLYEWKKREAVQDIHFDIIPIEENYVLEDVDVNITLESTSPYTKTLIGNFFLHKSNIENGEIKKEYNQYVDYGELIISNMYQTNKCLNISWDSNQLNIEGNFDLYKVDQNNYINEIKINMEGNSNNKYTYYNKIPNLQYNISNFQITETEC